MNKKKLPLHLQIIIGLILGIIWSFMSTYLGWNQFTINWINPFGEIFIKLLKLIAIPLVLFSIISGISGLNDTTKLGKIGSKTISLYLATTVIAIIIGLFFANIIQPGKLINKEQRLKNRKKYELWAESKGIEIIDNVKTESNEFTNITLENKNKNKKLESKIKLINEKKETSPLQFLIDIIPENIVLSISNNELMLQIIFFALFFGVSMIFLPKNRAAPVKKFIDGMNDVFLQMVHLIMKITPFFVFCLLAGVIAKMANSIDQVIEIFLGLGWYSITVILGIATMIFIIYPLILKSFVKKIYYIDFYNKISPAQFLAFSTSSSAATLPVTMECVTEKIGVSKGVASFVLPIGATINMDGTSLYQAIAVIFLAQIHMIDLTLSQQILIVFTTTVASIGSAAVPSAGLVMLIIVLQSVGLNPAWIAIIYPVDRILDMCRTVVNVTGDATVSTIVANMENELDYKK